ncbi:uncharacterized protein F5Z01DRAFT_697570 [Emericellopsis atlantica]|uniref:Uncharacterized protein n=1 Tax=Emericellopsis atlantica TaxID=2614577 RepID=A0A9P7ZR37_9HYPO|nr:uncharacterized protein F5Z01DRAFT_697570 [Emericellopsis atlantica]KAG9256763.1 hypothetical protein F5Z01DRAFT_697570 [Emericellopsis atlantica]
MKFSIVSVLALAASATATPILGGLVGGVGDALKGAVSKVGGAPQSSDDIATLLEGTLASVKERTGAMNATVAQVQSKDITADAADDQLLGQIQGLKLDLSQLVNSLTTAAGIPVPKGDVDRVLTLVNALLNEVLATVNTLVTVLGLRVQLTSLLHSVFSLLANILTLLIGLLGGLLPALVGGLTPLLAGLGNGLLAPLLTPIVALVAAISGP